MACFAALVTAGTATVHLLPGRAALLPAPAHWARRCGPTRLQSPGAAAADDAQWDAAGDAAVGWDAAPFATGAQSEEAGPVGGGWADDGGWEDSWSEEDGDPASSWLQPKATQSPPPAPRRPIEAVTVGMVTGPFARRNGYHVEVRVQHKRPKRESVHRLFVSNEVLIETARLKGYEQWDLPVRRRPVHRGTVHARPRLPCTDRPSPTPPPYLPATTCYAPASTRPPPPGRPPPLPQVGPFAEGVMSYLQQQGVALDEPDWGMQDESIPYSHEQVP